MAAPISEKHAARRTNPRNELPGNVATPGLLCRRTPEVRASELGPRPVHPAVAVGPAFPKALLPALGQPERNYFIQVLLRKGREDSVGLQSVKSESIERVMPIRNRFGEPNVLSSMQVGGEFFPDIRKMLFICVRTYNILGYRMNG